MQLVAVSGSRNWIQSERKHAFRSTPSFNATLKGRMDHVACRCPLVSWQAAPPPAGAQPSLTGRWRKDAAASDSADAACDMVQLPWLYRQAMKFLNVLEVNAHLPAGWCEGSRVLLGRSKS